MRRAEVGFLSFTRVPADAHHAYNAWHQLDHLPSQFAIEGVIHGERWVLTPACRGAAPVLDGELARAHYVTLYLMSEPVEPTLQEFRDLAVALRDEGRWFDDREAVLFGGWRVVGRAAAPRVLVDPEVVPWRPARGVVVVVDGADDPPRSLEDLVAVAGVAGAWSFERSPDVQHHSWSTGPYRVTVLWLDADPIEVAGSLTPLLADAVHAAPYARIDAGEWNWFD